MKSQSKYFSDSGLFALLLVFIFWVPLPFGSNQFWAKGILEIWIFLMSVYWLWCYFRGKVFISGPLINARYLLYLFVLFLFFILFQFIQLPADWVNGSLSAPSRVHLSHSAADTMTVSLDAKASKFGMLLSISYFLLLVLTLVLVRSRKRILLLVSAIVLSGVFQALYGSLMTLSGLEYSFFIEKEYYREVATGTFINRNHLAAYLEISLAVGIGLMIAMLDGSKAVHWKGRLRSWLKLMLSPKIRLRLYLVMMVIALILTHSRMGNTAFFASMLIAGVIGIMLSKHAVKGTLILLVSLVIIDMFLVGAWFGIDKVAERLERTSMETEARDNVYRHAFKIWDDYKFTGTGLGTFVTAFPKYRGDDITGSYRHAHNDYLQFATEVGIIGVILLGMIVIWTFIVALLAQARRRDPLMRGLSFAVIMGILARLIHASVEFNFQIPANAAMFVILLGLGWISLFHKEKIVRHDLQDGHDNKKW